MVSKKLKYIKQISSIFIVFLIVFNCISICSSVALFEYEAMPCYTNISYAETVVNISGLKAECSADLRAINSMTLSIKMELQKNKSGGYETVETWTSSKTGTYLSVSESRLINVFADYRLKVTFTAGTETSIVYDYP